MLVNLCMFYIPYLIALESCKASDAGPLNSWRNWSPTVLSDYQVRKHRKCQCEDLKVDLYGLGSSYFTILPFKKKSYKRQMSDVVLPWGHERNVQTAQSRSIRKSFNYNPERNTTVRSWCELTWSQNPSQRVHWPHSVAFLSANREPWEDLLYLKR